MDHLLSFVTWLNDTRISVYLRESDWPFPIIETIHILGLGFSVGTVMWLDLRLLGLALTRVRMSRVIAQLNPWLFLAYGIMLTTGVLLFCADPVSFWSTFPFKAKMVMLILAGLNVLIFNRTIGRRVTEWDMVPNTPIAAKLAGGVSIFLWFAIIVAGRAIAYVLPPPI